MRVRGVYMACLVGLIGACEVSVGDGAAWQYDAAWPDGSFFGDDDAGGTAKDAGGRDSGSSDAGASSVDARVTDAARDADAAQPAVDPVPAVTQTLSRGFCDALVECMGPELAREFLAGQDCKVFLQKQLADRENHWAAESVQRGRLGLNEDQLEGCSAALKEQKCAIVSSRLPTVCEEAIAGYVALDGECSISADCEGSLYCKRDDSCPGHCTRRAARGEQCSASTDCETGFLCRSSMCTSAPSEGDPCSTHMSWCGPGLICQGEPNASVCSSISSVYTAQENESCDAFGVLCQPEFVCVSEGGSEGRCKRRADSGGACGAALPAQCPVAEFCRDPATGERAAAGVAGVCSPKPGPGKACGDTGCQPGSVCSGGMCVAYGVAGDACGGDATCYGGRCSDGECIVAATSCELDSIR